jgi:serine phosphatase RsbU (regulator of sigma subunit)
MKKLILLFSLLVGFSTVKLNAQEIQKKMDSLIDFWHNKSNPDTARFTAINDFIWSYRNINADSCFYFIDLMFNEASLKNNQKYTARSWSLRGTLSRVIGNEKKALIYYKKASEIYNSYNDIDGEATSNNNIALLYRTNGMGNEALKMFLENKKTAIKIGDRGLLEVSLLNIGQTFFENNNYDSALTYFKKSIDLCNELKKEKYVKHKFWAFLFQGHIYRNQSKMELAIDKYNNCIKLAMSLNDLDGLSSAYSSVGYLFFLKDNYQKALLNYLNAEKYQKALSGHTKQGTLYMIYKNYIALKKDKLALLTIDKYLKVRDSTESLKSNNELIKLKLDKEFNLLKEIDSIKYLNEINLNQAEVASENQRRNGLIIIVLLVLLSLVFLYRQFNQTRKQKILIESKQKEIKDSISYAKKIQDAIMTSTVYIEDVLPKSFIFFQPKDVVSGDFYWVYKSSKSDIYIAVADCTGHGVPGAFMSMIGNSLLNEIIVEKKIENTAEILDLLREQIIKSLHQGEENVESKDGMDMSLCKINMVDKKIEFSGAYNSLIHVSKGELTTIKGDNQPVSLHYAESKPFTKKIIKVEKGDMIYLYSDGYQDQFGGLKDKKFMSLKFKNLLKKISNNTSHEQYSILQKEFNKWKGSKEQIDDVCVMGVRIV